MHNEDIKGDITPPAANPTTSSTETSSAVQQQEVSNFDFSFTGSGKDYFFICLRTFLLAVITLGIYDAWGTVERRRYLLRHTRLDERGFDYHALPKTILIGRLIAVGILIGFQIAAPHFPQIIGGFVLLLLVFMPWLLVKAIRFRTRNTSYHNVRFDFTGSALGAFLVYIVLPLLVVVVVMLAFFLLSIVGGIGAMLTSGLGLPAMIASSVITMVMVLIPMLAGATYITKKRRNYLFNHLRFGLSGFQLDFPMSKLFKTMMLVFFQLLVVAVLFAIAAWAVMSAFDYNISSDPSGRELAVFLTNPWLSLGLPIIIYSILGFIYSQYFVAVYNITLNHLNLDGGHHFKSTMRYWEFFKIIIVNIVAVILSVGLLYPWAIIRFRRYQLSNARLIATGGIGHFINHQATSGGAAAAELGAMEGLSDGIGDGIFG